MTKETFIEDLTHEIHGNQIKKIPFLNWIFLFGFVVPFIVTTILFILMMVGIERPGSWVNWLMFIIFIPLITFSLIVYQNKRLIGIYGETILILIPTFVWLLPGHIEAMRTILIITFSIVVLGFFIYSIGAIRQKKDSEISKKITQILLRLGYVSASVASTVVISLLLINWADYSVKLSLNDNNVRDYTTTSWILFISIVAILVALLLVILGLVANLNITRKTIKPKDRNNKLGKSFLRNTIEIKIKPRKKFKKGLRK